MKNIMFVFSLSLMLCACQEPVLTETQSQDLTQNTPTTSRAPSPSAGTATPQAAEQITLQGVVQEASTQKLLSGITVRLNELSQVTDEVGFFRFTNQPVGEAKLIIAAPNYVNINRNIRLTSALQTEDIMLTLTETPSVEPSVEPSTAPSTIILLPDGTATSAPDASASQTPSPLPSESPSPSPVPSPSPSPVNELNAATLADVLIQTRADGLRLSFTLSKSNGLPVNWDNQDVFIEYYIGTPDAQLLTSGKSFINASGESFVVSLGGRTATPNVNVDIKLLLPNGQVLLIRKTINVQGS